MPCIKGRSVEDRKEVNRCWIRHEDNTLQKDAHLLLQLIERVALSRLLNLLKKDRIRGLGSLAAYSLLFLVDQAASATVTGANDLALLVPSLTLGEF